VASAAFSSSRAPSSDLYRTAYSSTSSTPVPSTLSPFFRPFTMASQRLAYSLRNATRVNKALNAVAPFRRYANPVTPARTESTTLSNGLTVRYYLSPTEHLEADNSIDRYRALTMGSDVDCWYLDRCGFKGGNRKDKWNSSLPRTSGFQGWLSVPSIVGKRLTR